MAAVSAIQLIEEDLSGKKFYNRSFKGMNLAKKKMRGSLFFQCCFDDADLSESDGTGSDFTCSTFRNTNLYCTNWMNAKLSGIVFEPKDAFGITWTMACKTFDGMRVSPLWSMAWLYFFTIMKPQGQAADMVDKVIAAIGAERYAKLTALFSKRQL